MYWPKSMAGLGLTLVLSTVASSAVLAAPNASQPGTSLAQATGTPNGGGQRVRGKRGDILQELNFTDAQKKQMAAIRQKYKGQMQSLRQDMRSAHDKLGQLMASSASDNEIRAQYQKIEGMKQKLSALRFESMLEMRKVMTPQQRTQFHQMMQARRDRFRNGYGNGSGMGPGMGSGMGPGNGSGNGPGGFPPPPDEDF